MNSETYLDFCFVREATGDFTSVINGILQELFKGVRVTWYLDEKTENGADIVVAEVKGMSRWQSEADVIEHIETSASDCFWEYLQGYKFFVYPNKKGCGSSCGGH